MENQTINPEVQEAQAQLTVEEQRARIKKLFEESPNRNRAKYNPDFTLSPEYERLLSADTSKMSDKEIEKYNYQRVSLKKNGGFTNERRQAEIDKSLALPLSEVIKLRDSYKAQITSLEADMDNFDVSEAQALVDEITAKYEKQIKGLSGIARANKQSEYNKEVDSVELEKYRKPYNALALKRYEAIQLYKVYEARIKLYVSANREIIERQIERARENEVTENLLALAEYMEG